MILTNHCETDKNLKKRERERERENKIVWNLPLTFVWMEYSWDSDLGLLEAPQLVTITQKASKWLKYLDLCAVT